MPSVRAGQALLHREQCCGLAGRVRHTGPAGQGRPYRDPQRRGKFLSVGGYFTPVDGQADLLLNVLPAVIHIREEPAPSTLRRCTERMREELREAQPGGGIVAQQLATLVLVQACGCSLRAQYSRRLAFRARG